MLRTRTAILSNCLAPVFPVWQGIAVTPGSSPRRIGAEDSKRRAQLLEAAELLLLEEGYAAVTSRRVAAKAGLKPQLVHYYFRTMDDLFVAVFHAGPKKTWPGSNESSPLTDHCRHCGS